MSYKAKIIISEQVMSENLNVGQRRSAVINPSLKFRTPFIPGALTFAISIVTTGLDYSKDLVFSLKVFNKSNPSEIVFSLDNERVSGLNNNTLDNFGFDLSLSNQKFLSEGIYVVQFSIEDEEDVFEEFEIVADEVLNYRGQ